MQIHTTQLNILILISFLCNFNNNYSFKEIAHVGTAATILFLYTTTTHDQNIIKNFFALGNKNNIKTNLIKWSISFIAIYAIKKILIESNIKEENRKLNEKIDLQDKEKTTKLDQLTQNITTLEDKITEISKNIQSLETTIAKEIKKPIEKKIQETIEEEIKKNIEKMQNPPAIEQLKHFIKQLPNDWDNLTAKESLSLNSQNEYTKESTHIDIHSNNKPFIYSLNVQKTSLTLKNLPKEIDPSFLHILNERITKIEQDLNNLQVIKIIKSNQEMFNNYIKSFHEIIKNLKGQFAQLIEKATQDIEKNTYETAKFQQTAQQEWADFLNPLKHQPSESISKKTKALNEKITELTINATKCQDEIATTEKILQKKFEPLIDQIKEDIKNSILWSANFKNESEFLQALKQLQKMAAIKK